MLSILKPQIFCRLSIFILPFWVYQCRGYLAAVEAPRLIATISSSLAISEMGKPNKKNRPVFQPENALLGYVRIGKICERDLTFKDRGDEIGAGFGLSGESFHILCASFISRPPLHRWARR